MKVGETLEKKDFDGRFGADTTKRLDEIELKVVSITRSDTNNFEVKMEGPYVRKNDKGELRLATPFSCALDVANPNPLDVTKVQNASVYSNEYEMTAEIRTLNFNYVDEAGDLDLNATVFVENYGETTQTARLDPYGKNRNEKA